MKVRDLGELNGPILLFGGPYSNLPATKALFAQADILGLAADHVICTGDIAAYCAEATETIALVQSRGCAVVAGNCEQQLAAGAQDCGCGFESGTTCDLLSAGWYAHASRTVSEDQKRWMGGLPDMLVFQQNGRRYAVIHGGVQNVSRFIWPVSEVAVFSEEFKTIQAQIGNVDGVIAGHCGMAFEKACPEGQWLNAGAIGMPANSGETETQYMILRDGAAEICALPYAYDAAAMAMEAAGLTQGYHSALRSGYWPSEDVLPKSLRRAVG